MRNTTEKQNLEPGNANLGTQERQPWNVGTQTSGREKQCFTVHRNKGTRNAKAPLRRTQARARAHLALIYGHIVATVVSTSDL